MNRHAPAPAARFGDRSWLVGVAILALVGGGVASQAAGVPEQGRNGPKGAPSDTSVVCEPTDSSSTTSTSTTTTTTTTTVPGSTVPDPCAPDGSTTTTSPDDGTAPTTTAGGPGTTTDAPGTTTDGAAPDPSATTTTAAETTVTDSTTTSSTSTSVPAPPTSTEPDVAAPELPPVPAEDWPIRLMTFPVAGPVTYYDDWGACRGGDGCPRRHIGNDVIGRRLQPLVAAADGVVSHLVQDHPTAGWGLVIKDAEGWEYRYYHVNNDSPGTDDGSDPPEWRLAPGIVEGSQVKAGQVVAYMGDSGNSELSVPHLHFELHRPDGSPIDPYRSLRFSEWTARCSAAAPGVQTAQALMPPVNAALADATVATSTGRGQFLLSLDGTVLALGDADSVGWSRHIADDPACPPPEPTA
jgi:murein DD-endopeptidase MepM/ murein hydrolase activator NlpD